MNIELSPTGTLSEDFAGFILSEGTLKTSDLLRKSESFLSELETHFFNSVGVSKESYANFLETKKLIDGVLYDHTVPADTASDVWDSCVVFFNSIAPDGHYFGSHEGDGACFGFWTDEDSDYCKKQNVDQAHDWYLLKPELAQDLKALVDYTYDQEFTHMEEMESNGLLTDTHIFHSINRLQKFIEENVI